MTKNELESVLFLKREIEYDRRRLQELSLMRGAGAVVRVSARTGARSDKTCEYATLISELEAVINENMTRCLHAVLRVQKFINTVEKPELRVMLAERYIKGKSWIQTAYAVGEYSEDFARKRVERYLKSRGIK